MKKCLAIIAATVLALGAAEVAHADASFSDAAGDGSGAPDIGDVSVVNDSFGKISFLVELADGNELQADGEIAIVIDSDRNVATGTSGGWDYVFLANGADRSWGFGQWNGSAFDWGAPSATVEVRLGKGYAILSVNRSELGNVGSFDFFVSSAKIAGDQAVATDTAPEGSDYWSYSLVAKQLALVTGPVVRIPKTATAGKAFGIGFAVGRSDSPEAVAAATVSCRATVGGRPVAARAVFVKPSANVPDGVAACQLKLPATAKGKTLQLRLTVTYLGVSTTKTVTVRVL